MKKAAAFILSLLFVFSLYGCGNDDSDTTTTKNGGVVPPPTGASSIDYVSEIVQGRFSKFDQKTEPDSAMTSIVFSDSAVTATGNGVSVSGTTATIRAAGSFLVQGSCSDGQLIVDVSSLDQVHILLDGVSVTSKSSAPLWIKNADKTVVTLKAGTENSFSDGSTLGDSVDAPKACVYSKDDLTFNGTGRLTVNANVNNGIGCSNDLKFMGGSYVITAQNNGVKGNDSVAVYDAAMKITAGKDGIKADTADDAAKGFVYICAGTFEIKTEDDGIQSVTAIELQGGSFTFDCTGNEINTTGATHRSENVTVVLS